MRKFFLIPALILISNTLFAQTPQWYLDELKRLEGVWLTDNSEYMSEQETDDTYGLEWKRGIGKNNLLGELFGMKDGEKTGSYWQFFQYWDEEENAPLVIQVSPWGISGKGKLERDGENKTKVEQVFSNPDGTSFRSGHITEIFDGYEISTSYNINENGEWVTRRSYKWIKQ